MNKVEFMNALKQQLQKIPEQERAEILVDYEEHFRHGLENGRTEAEIARSLGSPKEIAKELITDYFLVQAKTKNSFPSLTRAIFASLGLGFLNLVFVLGPFIGLVGVMFSFYAVAVSLLVVPLASLASLIWVSSLPEAIFNLSVGLVCTGLGLLLWIGMNRVTRFVFHWFIRYVESNLKFIKGE
ncbi:DUF1700 domain-containing protein [Hazenella coriacea]|uniref:Putative membrane protein n=1 Tax=Hazenella coriacea TaxID=1179467 RepID=A0A4V2UUT7_9BACL|nr:DUF1700 domain-containing protein [Hazenella coriacea]TCS93087.1 putative membrane protein [Hazenella coriacea]